MIFEPTPVDGAYVIALEPIHDDRGFFARAWCRREFADAGLVTDVVQENVGVSTLAGTLRGLHFQHEPFAEAKLVRCTSGRIWDVALDLRRDSSTFLRWAGAELDSEARTMLYVPEGCAHGYVTLSDNAEVRYLTSQVYDAGSSAGVRYDDPAFAIEWPAEVRVISDADRNWPSFEVDVGPGAVE
jgi:dTDP-4-dehydrorhamnose 3,5-epimerase